MNFRTFSTIFLIGGIIAVTHAADPMEYYTPPMDAVQLPVKGKISHYLKSMETIDGATGENLNLFNYNYDSRNLPAGYDKYIWDNATATWVDEPFYPNTLYEWNQQELCTRNGNTTFEYDQYGRVIKSFTADNVDVNSGFTIEYAYDDSGRTLSEKFSYIENGKSRVSSLTTCTYVQMDNTYTVTKVIQYYDEAGSLTSTSQSIYKTFDDKTTRIEETELYRGYDGKTELIAYYKGEWKYPFPEGGIPILVYSINQELRDDVLTTVFESNATISKLSDKQWKVSETKHSTGYNKESFELYEVIYEELIPNDLLILSQTRWVKKNAGDEWELQSKSEYTYTDFNYISSDTVIFYDGSSNSKYTEYLYNNQGYKTEQNVYYLRDGVKIPYQHYEATLHNGGPTVTDYLVERYNSENDSWWTEEHYSWEYNFDVSIENVQDFGILNDDSWYAHFEFMLLKHRTELYGTTREHTYSYEELPDLGDVEEIFDFTSAPIRYYTLQGLPVNENALKSGIYIKCQGNHTEKIIVK